MFRREEHAKLFAVLSIQCRAKRKHLYNLTNSMGNDNGAITPLGFRGTVPIFRFRLGDEVLYISDTISLLLALGLHGFIPLQDDYAGKGEYCIRVCIALW